MSELEATHRPFDFFGRGYEPFDESEFSRRQTTIVTAGGDSLIVKAPEDTVLRKLLWFREGGEVSEKQWRDVVSVLQISGDKMDQTYLAPWTSRLHLSDLLERARGLLSICFSVHQEGL